MKREIGVALLIIGLLAGLGGGYILGLNSNSNQTSRIATLENQIALLNQQIQNLQSEIKTKTEQITNLTQEVRNLRSELEAKENLISNLTQQLEKASVIEVTIEELLKLMEVQGTHGPEYWMYKLRFFYNKTLLIEGKLDDIRFSWGEGGKPESASVYLGPRDWSAYVWPEILILCHDETLAQELYKLWDKNELYPGKIVVVEVKFRVESLYIADFILQGLIDY